MAKRPNLAAVDLKAGRTPTAEPARNKRANTFRLPEETSEQLRVTAAILDTDQSAIIAKAVAEWIERNREQLRAKQRLL